jgi:hypothetical protein
MHFAKQAAASVVAVILASNFWRAALTSAGGPPSSSSRGGGRSSNMSSMHVARESITYKCNHQSASLVPVYPCGCSRAQSIVTPVRMVCPCDAVDVRKFAWVSGNPIRLIVCVSELLHANSVSTGEKNKSPFARLACSTLALSSTLGTNGSSSSQMGEPSKSSSWSQMPESLFPKEAHHSNSSNQNAFVGSPRILPL